MAGRSAPAPPHHRAYRVNVPFIKFSLVQGSFYGKLGFTSFTLQFAILKLMSIDPNNEYCMKASLVNCTMMSLVITIENKLYNIPLKINNRL